MLSPLVAEPAPRPIRLNFQDFDPDRRYSFKHQSLPRYIGGRGYVPSEEVHLWDHVNPDETLIVTRSQFHTHIAGYPHLTEIN